MTSTTTTPKELTMPVDLSKAPRMTINLRTRELDILLAKGHNHTTAPLIAGFDFPDRGQAIAFGAWGELDDDAPFGEEQPMIDYLETRYDGYDEPYGYDD